VTDVPKEYMDAVEKARHELIQQVPTSTMKSPRRCSKSVKSPGVVEGRHSPPDDREQICAVSGGSALKNIGIQYLVDAVVDTCPALWTFRRQRSEPPTLASQWKR